MWIRILERYNQPLHHSDFVTLFVAAGVTEARHSRRALNRWMLAYTLIKNNSLISLRARNTSVTYRNVPTSMDERDPADESFYVSVTDTDMQKFAC